MATAKLSLTVTRTSYSIANNTSAVKASLYFYGNGVSWSNYQEPGTLTIDGTKYSFTDTFTKSTSAQLLYSKSKTVTHKSDGTKSITVKGTFSPTHTSAVTNLSTSKTVTLGTIPRKSDVSVSRTSIPADGATTMTVTATKKSSSFTDTIVVKLGSSYSKTVSSGVAFTIPATWCNAIGSTSTSATAVITVTTKSGSTTIGSTTKNLTITVPATSAFLPTVTQSISEGVSNITSKFGAVYLKGQSKVKVTASGSGKYGATISSYSTTIAGLGTYSGSSFTSGLLNTTGSVAITTTVKDSRGRSGSKTSYITVANYSAPGISSVNAYLCNSSGTKDPNGTYAKVTVTGRIQSVLVGGSEKNTKTVTVQYKADTASSWTTVPSSSLTTSGTTSFTITSSPISGFNPNNSYSFRAVVSDKLYTSDYVTMRLSTICISRLAGGKGVTLFKEATEEGFWVGDIDYTLSDADYNELLDLLGG